MSLGTGSALGALGREVGGGSMGILEQKESIGRLESILVLVQRLGESPGVCPSPPIV